MNGSWLRRCAHVLGLTLTCVLSAYSPAAAQSSVATNAKVVSVCGASSYPVGQLRILEMLPTGELCSSGSTGGGGGGGDASAANQVTANTSLSVIDDWDDGADSATVVRKPSAVAAYGLVPVVTATAASSKVIKASAGNFYGFNGTSGASAGYFLVYDLTAAPSNGTVTPVDCVAVPAATTIGVSYDPPMVMATGATVAFSTTGCFSQTLSVTAFISGAAK